MINFIVPETKHYIPVLFTILNPIKIFLTNYIISSKAQSNCVNVHFFREIDYLKVVGLTGLNVFLPHGIADKNYRTAKKVSMFDKVVISGQLWYEKMINQGLPKEKIFIGGYPKLDLMFNKPKKNNDKPIVLWCPTHDYNSPELTLSSYPKFMDYLKYIPDKYEVRISTHPANRENKNPTIEELINADIVIADSGSILYCAWFLNKPVIFPDWLVKDDIIKIYHGSFEASIYENNIGYHANNIEELVEMIDIALKNGLDDVTRVFAKGILPEQFRGCSGKRIADWLMSL